MKNFFGAILTLTKFGVIFGCVIGLIGIVYLEANLPSVTSLKDVQFQVPLRIYSNEGKLIAEYGEKRRTPVKIEEVPQDLINAILATEDIRFYTHPGVDIKGIIRAAMLLLSNGKKQQGGSTITMQVARNFFLSRKKTYLRKINEILLALKIEKELDKKEILELYLNKIYLGKRAYGVSAAANVYYGKELQDLTLAEMAMIAGLPQAPSSKNPLNNPQAAVNRREHVLSRMLHYKFITQEQFSNANSTLITAKYHGSNIELDAPYIAELVRQKLVNVYGETVYDKGLEVYTTVTSKFQSAANNALVRSVLEFDQRHGYRKPITNFETPYDLSENSEVLLHKWQEQLLSIPKVGILEPAVVVSNSDDNTQLMLLDGNFIDLPFSRMSWAAPALSKQLVGKKPEKPSDVVRSGDVVYIYKKTNGRYYLAQLPEIEAAIIALNPTTGAILGLVGGFDFYKSRFNRVTQAERQPGSNFKPFIYSIALENGFNAASIINDAPIVEQDPYAEFDWRPQNHTKKFYGPTRLRIGVTQSRNLVTIRILKSMGLDNTINALKKFGFSDATLPNALSLALGSGTITPLELATAYCTFPNGGYKISPYVVSKIVDYNNKVIFEHKPILLCKECDPTESSSAKNAPQVISPQTAYIMSAILQDAIQTGTGKKAKRLKRLDVAGKTGTTNDHMDSWYSGFTQEVVATTWMGYDSPRPINEYAASTALPMWIYFMEKALKGIPEIIQPQPEGIVTVKIDPKTGLLSRSNQKDAIYEIFTEDNVPEEYAPEYSSHAMPNTANKQLSDHDDSSNQPATENKSLF